MTGRQAANAMTRLAWIFGIALFCTSISLTILAAREASNGSIMDQFGGTESQELPADNLPSVPAYTPPPSTSGNPLTPPAPDAQAPAATTETPAAEPEAVETAPEAAQTESQPAN
jgi:preprotein translocase subunit SecG